MNSTKIRTYISDNKKIILISLIMWALVSYAMFLTYREEWYQARIQPKYVSSFQSLSDTESEEITLTENIKIVQKIKITSRRITGIALAFDAEKQLESGEIKIELRESRSDKIIGKWSRNMSHIVMGQFNDFVLTKQVKVASDGEYILVVSATNTSDSELKVSLKKKNINSNVKMLVDDIESDYAMEYRIINGNYNSLRFFWLLLYIGMTIVFFVVTFLLIKRVKLEWIFIGFLMSIGVMYLSALPPYTVPDEASHFVTTYAYSSVLLGEEPFDDEGLIIVENNKFWGAGDSYPNKESYDDYLRGVLRQEEIVEEKSISSRTPLEMRHPGYFPQVLGVTVARLLDFNFEQIFLFGRIFAVLWYAFVMFWAIRLMPFGKMSLIVIGTLPMTMQMVASYNYDSVLLGTCFFAFAYLLFLIYKRKLICFVDILILGLLGITIATIKFIYLPILGLALFIPKNKFKSGRNKLYAGIGIVTLSLLPILCIKLSMIMNLATPHTTFSVNPGEAITPTYFLQHPIEMFNLFYRTFEHQSTFYLSSMLASPLGWLDIWLPNIVVVGFVLILVFSFIYLDSEKKEIAVKLQLISTLLALVVMFLALLALLLDCTNVGSGQIAGFQGRYWLPILPMFMLLLRNKIIVQNRNVDDYIFLFMSYMHCMTIFYLSLTIIGR